MDIYDQDGIQEIVVNTTGANSSDGGRDYGEPNAPTTLARQTSDTPIEIQYFQNNLERGQVAFIGCLELVFQSMLYPGC